MKLNAIIGAYLILVAVPIFILYILSEHKIHLFLIKLLRHSKLSPINVQRLYVAIIALLMVVSVVIIRVPYWGNTVAFLAPSTDYYVNQTTSYNNGQYTLLVECGTRYTKNHNISLTSEAVTIKLNTDWSGNIEKWWDLPHLESKSDKAVFPITTKIYQKRIGNGWTITPPILNQDEWIEMSTIIVLDETTNPQTYIFAYNITPIENERSLYLEFTSNKPIYIKAIRVNDSSFYTIGTTVIPFR